MAFEQIENAKSDYTDKYVALVDPPPPLMRFKGLVGKVKTVNMTGRALVEWLGYHNNIGWYDIDLDYLKVVDKPAEPEPVKKTPAKKPVASKAGESKQGPSKKGTGLSPIEMLRQKSGKKASPADASESGAPVKGKPKPKGLSPLEQLRQQGGKKAKPEETTKAKPKGLSPLEQLRQQGGTKPSSVGDSKSKPPAKAKPKAEGLSPIEQLRQQGGTKKKEE